MLKRTITLFVAFICVVNIYAQYFEDFEDLKNIKEWKNQKYQGTTDGCMFIGIGKSGDKMLSFVVNTPLTMSLNQGTSQMINYDSQTFIFCGMKITDPKILFDITMEDYYYIVGNASDCIFVGIIKPNNNYYGYILTKADSQKFNKVFNKAIRQHIIDDQTVKKHNYDYLDWLLDLW